VLEARIYLIVHGGMAPLRSGRKGNRFVVRGCRCRWFSLCFIRARLCWSGGGCVDCIGSPSSSIAEYCAAEICHCAGRPPCVAEAIQETDTLLEFFCRAVDVNLQPARAEVAVYNAECYT
jgi:hypothetical protein